MANSHKPLILWCCGCETEVSPRLTSGHEVYPHRPDLHVLPFWRCDDCKNHVGCHHKTRDRTRPLGCIPTPEIRRGRQAIHAVLDPLWKSGSMTRGEAYRAMAQAIGVEEFHTAEIRTLEACAIACDAAKKIGESHGR